MEIDISPEANDNLVEKIGDIVDEELDSGEDVEVQDDEVRGEVLVFLIASNVQTGDNVEIDFEEGTDEVFKLFLSYCSVGSESNDSMPLTDSEKEAVNNYELGDDIPDELSGMEELFKDDVYEPLSK